MAVDPSFEVKTQKYCELISSNGASIKLTDGEKYLLDLTPGKEGQLTDNHGRNHIELLLNMTNEEVTVVSHSDAECTAGGVTLQQNEDTTLGPGACIDIPVAKASYRVFFGTQRIPCSSKRKGDDDIDESNKAKKSMVNKSSGIQSSLKQFFRSGNTAISTTTCKWRERDSIFIMTYGPQTPSPLIAAFDLDGTLTLTKSGMLPFKAPPEDWKFLDPCVPKKLAAVGSSGYRVVIFTNQGGMNHGKPSLPDFKIKLQAVMESLPSVGDGVQSVILMAAGGDDNYRKPLTGMWDYFIQYENGGVEVNMEQSYYIGDAAGRKTNWKKGYKKDFSCCDRKFAANIPLSFHTPDEFFLGEPPTMDFTWDGFNPFDLDYNEPGPSLAPSTATITSPMQEMVIFVGCPASGKTTFYKEYMFPHGYCHINRDKLGTMERCISEANHAIAAGRSVVIDNTSPSIESRLRFIQSVDKTRQVKIRCFHFTTPLSQCIHNNTYREAVTKDAGYKKVPQRAFDYYQSAFEEPKLDEGFYEIVKVVINMKFTSPKLEKLYKKFYI